jgi:hypothetical protein
MKKLLKAFITVVKHNSVAAKSNGNEEDKVPKNIRHGECLCRNLVNNAVKMLITDTMEYKSFSFSYKNY